MNHSESLSLSITDILDKLSKVNNIYTLDKKAVLHHFPTLSPQLIDVQLISSYYKVQDLHQDINVEKYIRRCIDSILNQSLVDFELILVNDGSSDQSGIICDEYLKIDKRIKVIHKSNGGLSDARNAGLNIALGDYLTISTYISRYQNVNSGIQLIDVSNLKIVGPTVSNYKLVPIRPINSEIYPKKIMLKVTGGDKTYDGGTVLGRVSRITLSGTYDGDFISLLDTWFANFSSPNVGLNNVDISNIDLSGTNVLNYVGAYVPFTRFILSKLLTITFSNVNKIYSISDTLNVFTIPFLIIGIAARLIIISPFSTCPCSLHIKLMSSTVSSVLTNLS